MRLATTTKELIDRTSAFIALSVGLASFIIAGLVVYSVLARELFRASENGVSEISTYLMAYITFVGAVFGLWEGAHVGVHLLTGYLEGRLRTATFLIANALLTVLAAVLAWLAVLFWFDAWQSGERAWGTLSIPLWIPYSAFALGNVMFFLVQIARLALRRIDFGRPEH